MPVPTRRILTGLAAATLPALVVAQWKTHWNYSGPDGPARWASLDPAYAACAGREQSPIDIRGALPAPLPPLRFEDREGPVTLVNNGYTAVRVDYASASGNLLRVGDRQYHLVQFHFHHPSEEWINGKPFDMNLHLMYQDAAGLQAGVSVMLRAGGDNASIRELWKYMPAAPGKPALVPGFSFNPGTLLPADKSYYEYAGSVTAPPCTEGVTWYVLRQPVEIGKPELAAFAKLYPNDVRPPQPLNGRKIRTAQ